MSEATARARKALLVAAVLRLTGATSADALAFTLAERQVAADAAGVGAPSDATWYVVVSVLQAEERQPDVFAGLPGGGRG